MQLVELGSQQDDVGGLGCSLDRFGVAGGLDGVGEPFDLGDEPHELFGHHGTLGRRRAHTGRLDPLQLTGGEQQDGEQREWVDAQGDGPLP